MMDEKEKIYQARKMVEEELKEIRKRNNNLAHAGYRSGYEETSFLESLLSLLKR